MSYEDVAPAAPFVEVIPPAFKDEDDGLARRLTKRGLANDNKEPLIRALVGRPGLGPGTLGLKEGCIWSDSSGGVGLVCGMVRGILEQSRLFSMRVHVGPPTA
jgi:hypothetical protein